MDTRTIVAANLQALMDQAADNKQYHLATQNQLAKVSGVGQKTISAILAKDQATGIDTLQKLAQAFKLQAWQLLVPDLVPGISPLALRTEIERDFYVSAIAVARKHVPASETPVARTAHPHSHRKSPKGQQARKTPTKS